VIGAAALLNFCAAALNQNDKHDDKQDSGNDPDQRCTVHCDSPFWQDWWFVFPLGR
jgi:hypothetical protein